MEDPRGRATPAQLQLARRILEEELAAAPPPGGVPEAAERACQKLLHLFAPIVTRPGAEVLLARALYLAREDHALLAAVTSGPDGRCLDGLEESAGAVETAAAADAVAAVLGNAIALLASFIGSGLVIRRLGGVWQGIPAAQNRSQGEEAQA